MRSNLLKVFASPFLFSVFGTFVLCFAAPHSGTRGAEFEGRAQVVRGEAWGDCGGCCGDKDEMEDKLLLIKGTYCFVFFDDEDKAPKVSHTYQ